MKYKFHSMLPIRAFQRRGSVLGGSMAVYEDSDYGYDNRYYMDDYGQIQMHGYYAEELRAAAARQQQQEQAQARAQAQAQAQAQVHRLKHKLRHRLRHPPLRPHLHQNRLIVLKVLPLAQAETQDPAMSMP